MRRALLIASLWAGCNSTPTVQVALRVPSGQHPLAAADQVVFSLVDGEGRVRLVDEEAPSATLQTDGVAFGSGYRLTLDGENHGDTLARGNTCAFDVTSSAPAEVPLYFALVDRFAPTAAPKVARTQAIAIATPSGPLVVGGASGSASLSSSERYDVGSGEFVDGPMLAAPRSGAKAVPFLDGTVLLLGGASSGSPGAELLTQGSFTPVATGFPADRIEEAAVALPDDSVLVTGGRSPSGVALADTLLVTARGSEVVPLTPMVTPRRLHSATLLGDRASPSVLIAGGKNDAGAPVTLVELYTPDAGVSLIGTLQTARYGHTATLLPSGLILFVGGYGDGDVPLASAELFDPATREAVPVGALRSARADHSATLLDSGRVLVVGGVGSDGKPIASAELFDGTLGATGEFVAAQPLAAPRAGHLALPLCDGTWLFVGGAAGAELFQPL